MRLDWCFIVESLDEMNCLWWLFEYFVILVLS